MNKKQERIEWVSFINVIKNHEKYIKNMYVNVYVYVWQWWKVFICTWDKWDTRIILNDSKHENQIAELRKAA